METSYNEDYFERGNELGISGYSNYRWIPELTIPLAFRMIELLDIARGETILDYGCAKGYLVKALRLLYRDAYGYDISEYALQSAPEDIKPYLTNSVYDLKNKYTWIISKDVFEHIDYTDVDSVISFLSRKCKKMFVIIPLGDGEKFNVPINNKDVTHVIKESDNWWVDRFINNGFATSLTTHRIEGIKDNYEYWPKGHGFFILRSKEE